MVNAIIFGPPGSGKGTYSSRLQSKIDFKAIATGDIFRGLIKEDTSLGRKVKGYVEKGLLVPDDVVIEALKQHLSKFSGKSFIFDGYPRTIDQAKSLSKIVKVDLIIRLNVPEWIIIERLSARRICKKCGEVYNVRFLKPKVSGICDKCNGSLYQRSDDTPAVIKNRFEVYEKQTHPIIQYYKEKNIPFIEFKNDKLDMPPEIGVNYIVEELKKMHLI
jgi:adenylate kinase